MPTVPPPPTGPKESLYDLVKMATSNEEIRVEFLTAFREQARTLDTIWEAYRRGVAYLPDHVASQIERALVKVPRILAGPPLQNEAYLSAQAVDRFLESCRENDGPDEGSIHGPNPTY